PRSRILPTFLRCRGIHHPGVPGHPSISVAEVLSAPESLLMPRFQHRLRKFDDLEHTRLATTQRRYDEPRVRFVLDLDDSPATIHTAHASPVEMIEISGPVDQVAHVS